QVPCQPGSLVLKYVGVNLPATRHEKVRREFLTGTSHRFLLGDRDAAELEHCGTAGGASYARARPGMAPRNPQPDYVAMITPAIQPNGHYLGRSNSSRAPAASRAAARRAPTLSAPSAGPDSSAATRAEPSGGSTAPRNVSRPS